METDGIILSCVFGGLLLINIISLILVYVTPYGQEYLQCIKKQKSTAEFIFWNFWMLLTGFLFWVGAFFEWLGSKKGEKSE